MARGRDRTIRKQRGRDRGLEGREGIEMCRVVPALVLALVLLLVVLPVPVLAPVPVPTAFIAAREGSPNDISQALHSNSDARVVPVPLVFTMSINSDTRRLI